MSINLLLECATPQFQDELASHVQGWWAILFPFGLERDTEDRAAVKMSRKDINMIVRGI